MKTYQKISIIIASLIAVTLVWSDRQLPAKAANLTDSDTPTTTPTSQKNQSAGNNLYEYMNKLSNCVESKSPGSGSKGDSSGGPESTPEPSAIAGLILAAGLGLWRKIA